MKSFGWINSYRLSASIMEPIAIQSSSYITYPLYILYTSSTPIHPLYILYTPPTPVHPLYISYSSPIPHSFPLRYQ